jgi:hypothetical protein
MKRVKKFEELFESFDGEAMYHTGAVTGNYAKMMDYNNQHPAIELEEEQAHTFKNLERILLEEGGDSVSETYEEDLEDLINHGIFSDPEYYDYKIIPMRGSQCHANSASFYSNYIEDSNNSEEEIAIVTGWALSNGMWVQHSWIELPHDGILIETTEVERDLYYGFMLNDKDVEKFLYENM